LDTFTLCTLASIKQILGDEQHYLQEAKRQEEFEADTKVALFESGSLLITQEYLTMIFPFLIIRFLSPLALLECNFEPMLCV